MVCIGLCCIIFTYSFNMVFMDVWRYYIHDFKCSFCRIFGDKLGVSSCSENVLGWWNDLRSFTFQYFMLWKLDIYFLMLGDAMLCIARILEVHMFWVYFDELFYRFYVLELTWVVWDHVVMCNGTTDNLGLIGWYINMVWCFTHIILLLQWVEIYFFTNCLCSTCFI